MRNEKPTLIQNQFGATFGGPIIKDKTFFFADYEGYRRITSSLVFATVPTAAQRNGQLGVPVRNPYTNVVYQDGNIPASQITPFAKSVMDALVLPVTNPNAIGVVSNNYENLPKSKFYNDKFDVKIDHNFNSSLNAFVRISHRKVNNYEAPVIPEPVFSGERNAYVYVLNQQLAGGVTYNVNPTSVLEFRLGISRTEAGKRPTGQGDPELSAAWVADRSNDCWRLEFPSHRRLHATWPTVVEPATSRSLPVEPSGQLHAPDGPTQPESGLRVLRTSIQR